MWALVTKSYLFCHRCNFEQLLPEAVAKRDLPVSSDKEHSSKGVLKSRWHAQRLACMLGKKI